MIDYKSNSNKSKLEPNNKNIQKIANGKIKKVGKFKTFVHAVISDDKETIKNNILLDVLVPAFTNAVSDIVKNSVDTIFGDKIRHKSNGMESIINYAKQSTIGSSHRNRTQRANGYIGVEYPSKQQAKDVLSRLEELIDTYKIASIADLYDLSGIVPKSTDNNYGWTDVSEANIEPCGNGYWTISMPRALPID